MNNVYRIYASLEKDFEPNEFSELYVSNDIKKAISLFMDKYPTANIMTVERVNYNDEKVFDDVYV